MVVMRWWLMVVKRSTVEELRWGVVVLERVGDEEMT